MAASSGGIVAGKAFVLIEAIDKTGTVLSKVGKRMKDFGSGLSSLGSSLLTKSLAAGAPLALAVNAFRNFQSVMSDLQKTSGATDSKIAGVSQGLMEISKATGVGPTDLAKGLQDLVAQGMDLDQAVASMQTVAQVSKATGSEITDVTKTAFQLQSALGIDPSQLTQAFDILAAAGKAGAFELKDIAQHLPTIASQAASLGVSGVDGAASLAAMLQVVRKGAPDAATAANNLSNLFAKVISPETIKSFQAAGVNIEEIVKAAQAKGENPLEAVLDTVQQITGGDTFKVGQIFKDMQARNAIIPLLRFRKEYEAIRDSSKGAVGIIDADAAASAATLDGMLQSLWATLQRIGITVGQTLWPSISKLGTTLSTYLAVAEDWLANNRGLILTFTGIIAGAALLGGAMVTLGGLVSVAGLALTGIATLLSPAGLILAGIAAAALALPAWGDAAQAAFEKVKDVLGIVGELMAEGEWGEIGKLAMEGIEASFDWAMETIKANWDIWLQDLGDALYKAIGDVWGWWKEKVTDMTNKLLGTEEVEMQARLNADEMKKAQNAVRWLEELRKKTLEYKESRDESKAVFAIGDSGRTADLRGKSDAELNSDLNTIERELEAAKRHLEWRTGTGLGGVPNAPAEFGARADTSVADREAERGRQQAAADAAASRLAGVLERERERASDLKAKREEEELEKAANTLMEEWFDEWDRVEAEQGGAIPGGAAAATMLAGEAGGGAPAATMLAGAPGGGAAAAVPLDSGIRVSANEAIERGSIEAARVVAGDQMTALAEQQLTVLEKIAANTSPANQPSDEEEAV